jgi:hypothetical protein
MCQGRSNARVALNVGIEAGIHNFRRISYRLFLRVFLPTLWGVSRTLCRLPPSGIGRLAISPFCRARRRDGAKPRSVLTFHRSQRRQKLLLDLHNLAKSELGRLGGIGPCQALQVAL